MKGYNRLTQEKRPQVLGLCGTLFLSYLPKRFTQFYRALYGDAMAATFFVSRRVKIWKFKMLYLQNERLYGTENLQNDFFLGHLQPSVDKNSEGLAILSLEFYDVTCKPKI